MTPHDRYQRLIDLKGEIKQADDLVAECERAEGEKLRALQTASEATIKQRQKRAELHDEARKLAKQASDDFLALIPEDAAAVDELIAVPGALQEPLAVWPDATPDLAVEGDSGLDPLKFSTVDDLRAKYQGGSDEPYLSGECGQAASSGYNSIFTEPADFQAQALQNGADKITAAFNEATGR